MKQIFIITAIAVLSLGADKTTAQTTQMNSSNVAAGQFEMNIANGSGVNHINVNYSIASPVSGKVKLELSSPVAVFFHVDISDASGQVVKIWAPSYSSTYYVDNLDISYLPADNYYVNIRNNSNGAILYSIPFTKNI
jgi:hypothetical protein